jgi:hypothetical protein
MVEKVLLIAVFQKKYLFIAACPCFDRVVGQTSTTRFPARLT